MFVLKAAVVGAGTLGEDVAEAIEAAGIPVVLRNLGAGYDGFGDADLAIEAVPEVDELKLELFAELDEVTPGRAILASGASSVPISKLGDATIRPDKVVGLHFLPSASSRVVEVVEGELTSIETVQAMIAFVQRLRRTPIRCADAPGFVVNRILLSAASELWRRQQETGADCAEIDAALTAARPQPPRLGPFAFADTVGLDTVLRVAEHLHESFGERFAVHPRLRELVAAGDLGRATGRGFYDYA